MNTDIATIRRENLAGSLWMIAAMGAFAIEDAFVKAAAQMIPIGQVLILFGLGGFVLFSAIAIANREPLFVRDVVSSPMLIRAVFEVTGRLFYVISIALIPLSTATVILQATPLVVVIGAVVFFGERVGWRRWLAIAVGLIGVFIIIEPGAEGFSILSLLAVIGMIGFAGRDLASRIAPATISTTLLGVYGFLAIIVAGILYSFWQKHPFVFPNVEASASLAMAVIAGVCAYVCLMKAMRTGEVSAVTPFRYTRLLFGVALGVLFFGEVLDYATLLGSGLIVLSGLFIIWRGRQSKGS